MLVSIGYWCPSSRRPGIIKFDCWYWLHQEQWVDWYGVIVVCLSSNEMSSTSFYFSTLYGWMIFLCVLGARSFHRRSLHHLGEEQNPYEQAISIIGRTLSKFDEDNLIPCFGFGDGTFCLDFFPSFCIWDFTTDIKLRYLWQPQHMIKRFSASIQMRDFVKGLKTS